MTAGTEPKYEFKAQVHGWARKLDVQLNGISIRPMRNKWASCSTLRHLTFATDVLPLPKALRDYIVVHELLHLDVPNHGRLWKMRMRAHLGDWELLEQRLKELAAHSIQERFSEDRHKKISSKT